MIQKLFNILFKKKSDYSEQAVIIPRAAHGLSRKHINPHAIKVLYRLNDAGFAAYLVGGGVRDLLLCKKPKDFDVATNATPEEVKKLFRNCLLIGRRFRIAHVRFGQDIIEVTTFRSESAGGDDERKHSKLGMLLRDNVYGTIGEDAMRRDFTINALYYNIADFSVTDFTQGIQDLNDKVIRLIGKPTVRYQEDPVRLLRAIRFAAKLHFTLHEDTEKPIAKSANLLVHVAPARLFDEFLKLFFKGDARNTYFLLEKYGLLKYLLPIDQEKLSKDQQTFIEQALIKTDERVEHDQSVNPAFLLAVFLWPKFNDALDAYKAARLSPTLATQKALSKVLNSNELPMAIPKRLTEIISDIWSLQWRLTYLVRHQAVYMSVHKRMRAAYDFLVLRASSDPTLLEAAAWWTHFQAVDHDAQQLLLEQLPVAPKKAKRYKRKPNRKKSESVSSVGE
ncbi:MAG: polynucleotide adenylyltransferase PcnB [Legionellales bacterium]